MSEIHLHKDHDLGLEKARALARHWVEEGAPRLGLAVKVEPGDQQDTIHFDRMGVEGRMQVSGSGFDLDIKLGMMMSAFKPMVEAEIERNLARAIEKASGSAAA